MTLNLSKGGVSVSGGVRGARFTVGKTGKRTTLGIPGTGLHWTEQESWGGSGRERRAVERSEKQREVEALSYEIEEKLEAYEALVDHWKDLPRIPSRKEFQAYSQRVEFKPLPPPDDPDYGAAKRELHKELTREKYQSFPFNMLPVSVSKNKAREELKDRWPDLANRMQSAYEKRLAEHEGRMNSSKASHDASETDRLESLSKIRDFDPEAQSLSSFLAECGAHIDRDRYGMLRRITPPEWIA